MTPIERARLKRLREELQMLRARYDCGAVSDGVYAAIRELETSIAWLQSKDQNEEIRT